MMNCDCCGIQLTKGRRRFCSTKCKSAYWNSTPEAKAAKLRWQKNHPKARREAQQRRRAANGPNPQELENARVRTAQYRKDNPEHMKDYRTNNQGVIKENHGRAQAKKRGCEIRPFPEGWWDDMLEQVDGKCLYPDCSSEATEMDHVVSFYHKGIHCVSNIQPLCRKHNGAGGKWKDTSDYRPVWMKHYWGQHAARML